MRDEDWRANRFEAHRSQLRAVAYRMLGSVNEADDAVQEAWMRLHRSDTTDVQNLGRWLTTVVGRICLDMLRSRAARREQPLDPPVSEPPAGPSDDPEQEALLADSVGFALLVVLDTLGPAERLAFMLHDIFAVPYEEIAPILGRTPAATKMLTSRARRRVQTADTIPDSDPIRHRTVVTAFLAAARAGDFDALLTLLDPDVALRAEPVAVRVGGATPEVHGAAAVATFFSARARGARPALVNGVAGASAAAGGRVSVVFEFTTGRGRITVIDVIADPALIDQIEVEFLTE
jgi:RNA polymerase sigma factor (sigma-70 family)